MEVPKIIHFSKILNYKPSILGIPHLWKTSMCLLVNQAPAEPRGVDADDLPALVGTQPRLKFQRMLHICPRKTIGFPHLY
jgi:hypothetical protein